MGVEKIVYVCENFRSFCKHFTPLEILFSETKPFSETTDFGYNLVKCKSKAYIRGQDSGINNVEIIETTGQYVNHIIKKISEVLKMLKEKVPIWCISNLTIEEAAEYFNIEIYDIIFI